MRKLDAGLAPFTEDARFTGSVSGVHLAPDEDSRLHAYVVSFQPGGRTAWHAHDRGQLLICTAGVGYVANRSGEVIELRPGVAAWTDAGEHHWHGAGRDEPMIHIAVQTAAPGGDGATWLEAVSAGEWRAAVS